MGDAIIDPAGDWDPSTAEQYIDSQIATVTSDLAAEVVARQTGDTGIQDQVNIIKKNRIYLTGTTLSQSQINQSNTIYIIKDDLTLTENITVPADCVLKFDGGSISGDNYTVSAISSIIIKGYGLKCNLSNSDYFNFENPYCVSTIHGLKTGADGSPNKPFYYLQDALDICNNIVIENNSIISFDQAVYTYNKYNQKRIAILQYNTKISNYGIGKTPLLSGKAIINNFTVSVGDTTRVIDFSNSNLGSALVNITPISYNEASWLYNFGYITDGIIPYKLFPVHIQSTSELIAGITYRNVTAGDYSKIEQKSTSLTFFERFVSVNCTGISANRFSINIENIDFDSIFYGITGLGDNSCIRHCSFSYIGGGSTGESENSIGFAGNAIESYTWGTLTAKNIIVEGCNFEYIFDTAISLQGSSPFFSGKFYNNNISGCKWAFEFFNENNQSENQIDICNNTIKNCDMLGGIWRYHTFSRDLPGSAAPGGAIKVDTKTNVLELNSNIIINCNVFVSTGGLLSSRFKNNVIIIKENGLFKCNYSNLSDNPFYINKSNIENALALINRTTYGLQSESYNNRILLVDEYNSTTIPTNPYNGQMAFNGTKPIWWNGTAWVDSTGTPV